MNPDELTRKAVDLKTLLQQNERAFAEGSSWNEVWHIRQQLEDTYAKLIVVDFERAIQEKIDQDLWNVCFRGPISVLQNVMRRSAATGQKGVNETQACLAALLDASTGFYTRLIAAVKRRCAAARLDAAVLLGADFSESPPHVAEHTMRRMLNVDPDTLCDFLHNSYVHLGDIARYRGDAAQAATWYRTAIGVSNARQGHAFNQLAILESVTPSSSSSSAHAALRVAYLYARSVGAPQPFSLAESNLNNALRKWSERFVASQFESGQLQMELCFLLIQASCTVELTSTSQLDESKHQSAVLRVLDLFISKLQVALARRDANATLRATLTMMSALCVHSLVTVHSKTRLASQRDSELTVHSVEADGLRFVEEGELETFREHEKQRKALRTELMQLEEASKVALRFALRFCAALLTNVLDACGAESDCEYLESSTALDSLVTVCGALRYACAAMLTDSRFTSLLQEHASFWFLLCQLANSTPRQSIETLRAALPIDLELAGFAPLRSYHEAYELRSASSKEHTQTRTKAVAFSRLHDFCDWLAHARSSCQPRLLLFTDSRFTCDLLVSAQHDLNDVTVPSPLLDSKKRGKSKNIALQSIRAAGHNRNNSSLNHGTEGKTVAMVTQNPSVLHELQSSPNNAKNDEPIANFSELPLMNDLQQCLQAYQSQMQLSGNNKQLTVATNDSAARWTSPRADDVTWNNFGGLIQSITTPNGEKTLPVATGVASAQSPWQSRMQGFNATVGSNKPTPSASPSPLANENARLAAAQRPESNLSANSGAWSSFLPSPLERAVREAQLDSRSPPLSAVHEQQPG